MGIYSMFWYCIHFFCLCFTIQEFSNSGKTYIVPNIWHIDEMISKKRRKKKMKERWKICSLIKYIHIHIHTHTHIIWILLFETFTLKQKKENKSSLHSIPHYWFHIIQSVVMLLIHQSVEKIDCDPSEVNGFQMMVWVTLVDFIREYTSLLLYFPQLIECHNIQW